MRASIFFREPLLLCEMRGGDLFVPHLEPMSECVCAVLLRDELEVDADAPEDDELDIVVIACRVGLGEEGFAVPGFMVSVHPNTWVTRVVPIERIAFREDMPLDDVPAVSSEREPRTPPRCTCGAMPTE